MEIHKGGTKKLGGNCSEMYVCMLSLSSKVGAFVMKESLERPDFLTDVYAGEILYPADAYNELEH